MTPSLHITLTLVGPTFSDVGHYVSSAMKSQLVALWALASWNLSVSRVDAQIELISAWTTLLQLALFHLGDKCRIPKALAGDAKVRAVHVHVIGVCAWISHACACSFFWLCVDVLQTVVESLTSFDWSDTVVSSALGTLLKACNTLVHYAVGTITLPTCFHPHPTSFWVLGSGHHLSLLQTPCSRLLFSSLRCFSLRCRRGRATSTLLTLRT